jgi:hypothetical protein
MPKESHVEQPKRVRSAGSGSSRRLYKQFSKTFGNGLAMWTSEDGTLLSLAIVVRDDWREVLQREFAHILTTKGEGFDENRGKLAYVEWGWNTEYFDGNSGKTRGKVWTVTEEKTPFRIINYQLKIPR